MLAAELAVEELTLGVAATELVVEAELELAALAVVAALEVVAAVVELEAAVLAVEAVAVVELEAAVEAELELAEESLDSFAVVVVDGVFVGSLIVKVCPGKIADPNVLEERKEATVTP